MPAMTEEGLRKTEAALGALLTDEGKTSDPLAKRRMQKRLRRVQRKRRRIVAMEARRAVKPKAAEQAKSDAAPAKDESTTSE